MAVDPKTSDDGLLQVREITRLRFDADLVTLSACDTGVGKLQGEEGVTDLAEAFLVSGSKSVVASLWSADDTFTHALMDRFYTHIVEGKDQASALRDAKLDLLAKYGKERSTLLLERVRFNRRRRVADSIGCPMSLEPQAREKIYARVSELVKRKHFDPGMNGADWTALASARRDQVLQSSYGRRI